MLIVVIIIYDFLFPNSSHGTPEPTANVYLFLFVCCTLPSKVLLLFYSPDSIFIVSVSQIGFAHQVPLFNFYSLCWVNTFVCVCIWVLSPYFCNFILASFLFLCSFFPFLFFSSMQFSQSFNVNIAFITWNNK